MWATFTIIPRAVHDARVHKILCKRLMVADGWMKGSAKQKGNYYLLFKMKSCLRDCVCVCCSFLTSRWWWWCMSRARRVFIQIYGHFATEQTENDLFFGGNLYGQSLCGKLDFFEIFFPAAPVSAVALSLVEAIFNL